MYCLQDKIALLRSKEAYQAQVYNDTRKFEQQYSLRDLGLDSVFPQSRTLENRLDRSDRASRRLALKDVVQGWVSITHALQSYR